jgi:hypothetical protein
MPAKLTDQRRALASDWGNVGPIVYGLAGSDGAIVYVGATRNPTRRFAYYRSNKNCHNDRLSAWLAKNEAFVYILHVGIDGLFEAERAEIKSRPDLFNLIGGGEQNWREHAQKPWMAGTGILCPSALALRRMAMFGHPCHHAVKAIVTAQRNAMTDSDRTAYEVNVARTLPQCDRVKKWVSLTEDRVIQTLEARHA